MYGTHPQATIEALLIPADSRNFFTTPRGELDFDLEHNTVLGDARHGGLTNTADMRAPAFMKGKDTVLNRQSVSIVSGEDLDHISEALELDSSVILGDAAETASLDNDTTLTLMAASLRVAPETLIAQPSRVTRLFLAQCLGANVILGSYQGTTEAPTFRELGRGTDVGPYDPGHRKFTDAAVMITRPNEPCHQIVSETLRHYPTVLPRINHELLRLAQGRRGFVGMVSKGGKMLVGQSVQFVPFGER